MSFERGVWVAVALTACRPSWDRMPTEGRPRGRTEHSVAWTGQELFVWGGFCEDDVCRDGALFDPVDGSWTMLEPFDVPSLAAAVWTGSEVILWGSDDPVGWGGDVWGAVWSPDSGWRAVSSEGAPISLGLMDAVWTGSELVIWGGVDSDECVVTGGAAYDPTADRWRTISDAGAPLPRAGHATVWTGREVVVWGGALGDGDSGDPDCSELWSATSESQSLVGVGAADGGAWDPTTDTWRTLTDEGAPPPAWWNWGGAFLPGTDVQASYDGERVVLLLGLGVYESTRDDRVVVTNAAWYPDQDRWELLPMPPAPWCPVGQSWKEDDRIVFWGRDEDDCHFESRTARTLTYDLSADAWTEGPPAPKYAGEVGAWTGEQLVTWGGRHGCNGERGEGWIYSPE